MTFKNIIRIILSLLLLAYGGLMTIYSLKPASLNYYFTAGGVALSVFSLGWLFNLRFAKVITGILLIPVGLAGAAWTIWDFFQDILFDRGVIGNYPLLGNGMTIFLVPYLVVLGVCIWIVIIGVGLVKDEPLA